MVTKHVTKQAVSKCFSNAIFAAMSKFKTIMRYCKYVLTAKTSYDVHGPFIFNFINDVVKNNRHYYAFDEIEYSRKRLLGDKRIIVVEDFGAGSKINKTPKRKVSAIAKNTLITPKFGQLMFRIVDYLQPKTILEIGTSLGISTLYLTKAALNAKVITLEGSQTVAEIAQNEFKINTINNIELLTGEFSSTLPEALKALGNVDLAFVDGNHRLTPTLQYFELIKPYLNEHSVVIFDDIHWSDEMEAAWQAIIADPMVTMTIDLFFKGIVFFKKDFHVKSNFVLQF